MCASQLCCNVCPRSIALLKVKAFERLEAMRDSTAGMSSPVAFVRVAVRLFPMKRTLALLATS
jgi:hypothetical protein